MSKCFPGRKRHRFRHPRTMGPLKVKHHGDMECWWCKKTYRQVIAEQRSARKMRDVHEDNRLSGEAEK